MCVYWLCFSMDRYNDVFVLQTFNASGDILTFIGREDKAQFLGPGNNYMHYIDYYHKLFGSLLMDETHPLLTLCRYCTSNKMQLNGNSCANKLMKLCKIFHAQ